MTSHRAQRREPLGLRRRRALTASAVMALFAVPMCTTDSGTIGQDRSSVTTSTMTDGSWCVTQSDSTRPCAIPGRPLRRRRRRSGLLLPADDGVRDFEARTEYASVASFAELALQLMALGAPAALVGRCHRAALDEITHATTLDRLAGRDSAPFGSIPHLLGRRIGGRIQTRRRHLARLAVESYRDGWLNEGFSAADMEQRARDAQTPEERGALKGIAADERSHAELGRDVVLWCFGESPQAVGRALARMLRATAGRWSALSTV